MLKVVATHVPPPPGVASPLLWGTEGYLRDLFDGTIDTISTTERTFTFRFRSAEAFVDYFREYYGPTLKAFEAVGHAGSRRTLRRPGRARRPARRHRQRPGRDPRDMARVGRGAH